MSNERARGGASGSVLVEEDSAEEARGVLEQVAAATPRAPAAPPPGLRTARLLDLVGVDALIAWRGSDERMRALVAADVEPALLREALAEGRPVLVEHAIGETPIVVGFLQTRRSAEVLLAGDRVELRADREILLRTGRAGLRLREDGEIELVGARVSAISRGLFRIVGRMLKLN